MRRLLIFLKYPTPGKVKTRLAASVGDQAASDMYRACTEVTLERLAVLCENSILCVDPPDAIDATRAWLGDQWTIRAQQGRTLGERLAHAIGEVFADGAQRVVTIGTDSPWLTAANIEEAFESLRASDVVIGPTEDGGYYLIGLSRSIPALFDGIAWSTSAVYQETINTARTLGLRIHTLPSGYDIDRPEDLQRFRSETSASQSAIT